jgi:hypothetical protein
VDGVDQNNFKSALGFIIQGGSYTDNGGTVTQRHAELADRWWGVLMRDLTAAGYDKADPTNIRGYVRIVLHKPIGPDSFIDASMYNEPIGGYYDHGNVHVPGDYTDPDGMLGARPAYQPLLHEYTHHWCQQVLGHLCLAKDEKGYLTKHVWPMPNGADLWLVQWQNNAPAASVMKAQSCSHLTDLSGPGSVH